MACKHVDAQDIVHPMPAQSVYKEDCTQCFDSRDSPTGLNVCLYCFNGGCTGERDHARLHSQTRHHPLVLNIQRSRKKVKRDEPPQKVSKLAIAAETEEDHYETITRVDCYECGIRDVDKTQGRLSAVVDGILKANTFSQQAAVKAWELEMTACEHTLSLQQAPKRTIASQELGQCSMCDIRENLWLCLECGNLGCGRAQFGALSGNGHGLDHATSASHSIAVKLGSITAEGNADIYCYACDEERIDPDLAGHLLHWGINIADRVKTEKSLTEMNVDENMRWEFSMTTQDGKEMRPLFGEGFTGLKNLGNSCYLASILQCLFSLPNFKDRYYHPGKPPPDAQAPAEDLETQLRKLADGLLSGRYSNPDTDIFSSEHSAEIPSQKGLAPAMLKHLVGRGHEEFSTARQQDAFELLLHLLKLLTRSPHPAPLEDPVQSFRFVLEQRLQCLFCKRVRYRTDEQDNLSIPVPVRRKAKTPKRDAVKDEYESVTLKECLDLFTSAEMVELTCPACGSKDGFSKQSLFKTFPQNLAINARRFELVNWVPTKLDVPVVVGEKPLELDNYLSSGHKDTEELLPDDVDSSPAFVPNEAALGQLEAMGFPRNRCEKALHATGNADADTAMNWLFQHMEDPDIDTSLNLGTTQASAGSTTISQESIDTLGAMGISAPQARKALKETGGDVNRALDWVFSHPDEQGDFGDVDSSAEKGQSAESDSKAMAGNAGLPATFHLQSIVCHKGASIHAGHYVAFIRKKVPDNGGEEAWVLFNDEKVVKAEGDVEEMKKFAYVKYPQFQQQDIFGLQDAFRKLDVDDKGYLDEATVIKATQSSEHQPYDVVRGALKQVELDSSRRVELDDYVDLISKVRGGAQSAQQATTPARVGLSAAGGAAPSPSGHGSKGSMSGRIQVQGSSANVTHTINEDERTEFTRHINAVLAGDPDLGDRLPFPTDNFAMFDDCKDGLVLAKLINDSVPDTIDERVLNRVGKKIKTLNAFHKTENNNIVINSAKGIGCSVVNIGSEDLVEGREHLILGLIWQIIRRGLLGKIDIRLHPELYRLLEDDETLEQFLRLPPEQILLRWFNYHLKNAKWDKRVANFSTDVKEGDNYTVLLSQLAPDICTRGPLQTRDLHQRAEQVLQNADKLDCRKFLTPTSLVAGNPKLNLAFVANLFNTHPGLDPITEEEKLQVEDFDAEGEREARVFTLWLNSLDVQPAVNSLFDDLRDGSVLLQAYDKVIPGSVNFKHVNKPRPGAELMRFKAVENTNYAIELGKQMHFSLVGVQGADITDGQRTLTLGLVWQLMRRDISETLSALAQRLGKREITDAEMIKWANEESRKGGRNSSIRSFKDQSIGTGTFLLDVLNGIKSSYVDYDMVTSGRTDEEAYANAKLSISIARKMGATIWLVPEDICQVRSRLVTTFIGSLMATAEKM